VPQAGFCEGETHNSAGSNRVTLPRPKGGSKRGIQSRPTHRRSSLYSTNRVPAYITWAQYERNLARLEANRARAERKEIVRQIVQRVIVAEKGGANGFR
jgi:hypothetical protein